MSALLTIKDLVFKWPQSKGPLLNISHLNIEVNERIFLQGVSGSGKTTLLNLLAGVLSPSSGSIEVLQTSFSSLAANKRDRFRADHMGFIFQMFNLLPYYSAIENVTLPCKFSSYKEQRALANSPSLEKEAERLLSALGLKPHDIEGKSVMELSVGQQQRVAAARALIGGPELLIADEPTSALDEEACHQFLDLFFSECQRSKSSVLFVSHDKSLGPLFHNSLAMAEINLADPSRAKTPEPLS